MITARAKNKTAVIAIWRSENSIKTPQLKEKLQKKSKTTYTVRRIREAMKEIQKKKLAKMKASRSRATFFRNLKPCFIKTRIRPRAARAAALAPLRQPSLNFYAPKAPRSISSLKVKPIILRIEIIRN